MAHHYCRKSLLPLQYLGHLFVESLSLRPRWREVHDDLSLSVAQLRIETPSVSPHISPWHTGNTVAKS